MLYTTLLGLLVVPAMSKAIPLGLQTTSCILPANFTVSGFTVYTDDVNSNKSYISFSYSDLGTGIDTTLCRQNSTSKPGTKTPGSWLCDNQNVAFMYNTTEPNAELTMIETACPASGGNFEATGFVYPDLTCTNVTTGSSCINKQPSVTGIFVSLEPFPPPSR